MQKVNCGRHEGIGSRTHVRADLSGHLGGSSEGPKVRPSGWAWEQMSINMCGI